jgi:hypothetical protein
MPYIGNQPAEQFTSFATQEFSTSATTSYTLDHAVTNENEIALFINNVRQQPGSGKAYTASSTTLTLSAATASTDTMYCVFLGRALQTVTPATNSITAAMVGNDLISGKDALTSEPASTDELLVSDAGTLKRFDFSLITNTPAFRAQSSGAQTISTGSETKLQFATEDFDTDSDYDNSTNYRFTPSVAGKYFIRASVRMATSTDYTGLKFILKKNGTAVIQHQTSAFHYETRVVSGIITFNGSSDYVEVFIVQNSGGNVDTDTDNKYNFFEGFRLIGV